MTKKLVYDENFYKQIDKAQQSLSIAQGKAAEALLRASADKEAYPTEKYIFYCLCNEINGVLDHAYSLQRSGYGKAVNLTFELAKSLARGMDLKGIKAYRRKIKPHRRFIKEGGSQLLRVISFILNDNLKLFFCFGKEKKELYIKNRLERFRKMCYGFDPGVPSHVQITDELKPISSATKEEDDSSGWN